MTEDKKGYYFASSCLNWNRHEKLYKLVNKQKLKDRCKNATYNASSYHVYWVPGNVDDKIDIENYRPLTEGSKFLYTEEY
jgi:ribonucleotide reductase beta subunit family protein with ferritin-like domain